MTIDQISKFLKTAHQLFPDYYALFVCAFSTGMRLGEILALAWEDIDFDKNIIKVERSYSHGNIDTTKNGKVRFVDMPVKCRKLGCTDICYSGVYRHEDWRISTTTMGRCEH